jgi:hypothetical protein
MKEWKMSDRKLKKPKWQMGYRYSLHSYEDVYRYLNEVDKRTGVEAEEFRRKFLRHARDYMTTYGPDHGLYVDEFGYLKLDPTARGYQAAMGKVS